MVLISMKINEELLEKAKKRAKEKDLSLSAYIRRLIMKDLRD